MTRVDRTVRAMACAAVTFASAIAANAATTETLTPAAIDYPGATATIARGINEGGQIVGTFSCRTACTNPVTGEVSAAGGHGFLLDHGVYTRIDVPAAGARSTVPRGISVQGIVVGHYNVPVTTPEGDVKLVTHGFTYSVAEDDYKYPIDVPAEKFDHPDALLRNTLPVRMSPEGDLVGCYHEDDQTMTTMHGWLRRNGEWIPLATPHAPDDTTSHDPDTMNNGLASTGRIAGLYFTAGVSYVADENGVIETFTFDGNLFTLAWDINARGDVVGVHGTNAANTVGVPVNPRGFLRNARGEFRDLVIPGAIAMQVFGINDARDIVGSYTDAAGVVHGFAARLSERRSR